ncbi:MAG: EF-hand domain-containing protein [Pseudomonadota bacterium]|uniref:hypothetical protein n=1 Tax=Sphingobium naphthae TaxID=1886786 RepID=UPI002B0F5467|nr:EF-hand domain-containing protein [Pseudomonadota bacterium]
MRLPALLLAASLLAPSVAAAQPQPQPQGEAGGPWAADADRDGRITRDEMRVYMERRFGLMDPDGDGLVPVQTMQRMLGHERRAAAAGGIGDHGSRGEGRGRGGLGGRGPGGAGGPPLGSPPPGDRADAGAPPPPPPGRSMPWPEDGNDDGQIGRDEFLAPALVMFDDQDRNDDGVLSAKELPPPHGDAPRPEEAPPAS